MTEIGAVVWGVRNVYRAVEFRTAAPDHVKYPAAEDWAILVPKSGESIRLSISRISSPKAKRHYIDLFADDREKEAETLLSPGATRKERNYEPDADYVVLNDPDGNPFCVVRR